MSSTVMIQGTTLVNVTEPFFTDSVNGGGLFFSDQPLQVYNQARNESTPVKAIAKGMHEGTPFLRVQDRPPSGKTTPTPSDAPRYSTSITAASGVAGVTGGIAGGVMAAIVLVALSMCCVKRRRIKKARRRLKFDDGSPVNRPVCFSWSSSPTSDLSGLMSHVRYRHDERTRTCAHVQCDNMRMQHAQRICFWSHAY